ncbi:hypothetical protein [Actinomadura mexicana]|uniref:Uncharacterized protein n=1 Tax=Actinomadura mexicana TaxID=134959 RepID=A0A239DF48_9ACTN|nr:hypothetical protein [Actinomadura mexicana]SNS31025.1 hypothetical protein SAMN06265355_114138 [Actinomadura mexicana]
MATAGPVAAGESIWEMPDVWRRIAHPRRDRPGPWPRARIDAAAAGRARALVEASRADVEDVLALPGTAPELAENGLPFAACAFAGLSDITADYPQVGSKATWRVCGGASRPEQRWLGGGATGSFADLDPVTVSEILADLATLS